MQQCIKECVKQCHQNHVGKRWMKGYGKITLKDIKTNPLKDISVDLSGPWNATIKLKPTKLHLLMLGWNCSNLHEASPIHSRLDSSTMATAIPITCKYHPWSTRKIQQCMHGFLHHANGGIIQRYQQPPWTLVPMRSWKVYTKLRRIQKGVNLHNVMFMTTWSTCSLLLHMVFVLQHMVQHNTLLDSQYSQRHCATSTLGIGHEYGTTWVSTRE